MAVAQVLELVGRMREGTLSRNRNFDVYLDPDARQARRLCRYLRALERDLCALGTRVGRGVRLRVEARPEAEGGRRITIEVPEVRIRRVAVLSAEEYELLREQPDARAILDRAES